MNEKYPDKNIILNPKSKEEQDSCGHKEEELAFNIIPYGVIYCPRCGYKKKPTQHDWDNL